MSNKLKDIEWKGEFYSRSALTTKNHVKIEHTNFQAGKK
jgi:hypothetical protein